jgi:hypothetical protein
MFIDQIALTNVRSFATGKPLTFVHPDYAFRSSRKPAGVNGRLLPRPKLPNVNLLLGENGSGKSTVLRAVAAAAFGPAAKDLLRDSKWVRFGESKATIFANLRLHKQDGRAGEKIEADIGLSRRGERLDVTMGSPQYEQDWAPVYESANSAFFVVGYGATRRVEPLDTYDPGARVRSQSARDLRVQSLFAESFSLIPLASWLVPLRSRKGSRYEEIVDLLNRLLKPSDHTFIAGEQKRGDLQFTRAGMAVPFQLLSDGYRAFIGWVGDLLYHLNEVTPHGKALNDNSGIVLVDEIDLLLHPRWQMRVIRTVARTFPRLQFIFTSHSPLIAGSLEWMNIITLQIKGNNRTVSHRFKQGIHGLDVDQILLTKFFGLETTRATPKRQQLSRLRHEATMGDDEAKKAYVRNLVTGTEPADDDTEEYDEEVP